MANGHGGYRQPTNPSPVSGPGALSQRTDGPLHAPVPGTTGPAPAPAGPDPSSLVPLGAPTQRPDEALTAGLSGGAGPGPALPPEAFLNEEEAETLRSYLPVLLVQASMPDASPSFKQYVRQLRAEVG